MDAALLESLEEPPAAPEVPILWRDLVPAAELLYGPLAEGVHAASFRGLLYYAGPLPRARVARRSAGRTVLFP
ncbi:MAG: hypothetical protein M5U26_20275 [Planctomycetota bacterium]|nr:hypothetical protein [Planctomycetota bacterium]